MNEVFYPRLMILLLVSAIVSGATFPKVFDSGKDPGKWGMRFWILASGPWMWGMMIVAVLATLVLKWTGRKGE